MRAQHGQILVAERTIELLGDTWTSRLGATETVALKGFSRPANVQTLVR
jgi:class 3 adenylate cyclase